MTKRTRTIILLACVACFLIIAPVLVLYSMGYRFDFEKMKITETGGIYVVTYPVADKIIIDSKISEKPGMFSNSIFVQSLLPNDSHTVLAEKSGYYDYSKTIPVQEKEVTKLENILLFKKNIKFEVIIKQSATPTHSVPTSKTQSPFDIQEKYIIKNGNLYYSDTPENSALTAVQKSTPLLKKVVSFALQNNNIIWLGADGFLYKSDSSKLLTAATKITLTAIKISKTGSYTIIADNNNIFVIANGALLILNTKTTELDTFYASAKDAAISPDGNNIVYFTDKELYISSIPDSLKNKTLLYKSAGKITACLWLNNYYVIIASANTITISETDYRDNINIVTLPQTAEFPGDPAMMAIEIKNPQIFFNRQEGKLYILTGTTLLASEKLTP